jgi:hypothetical protein
MAKPKAALQELESDRRIPVAVQGQLVAHSIEHYCLWCNFLKNLLLRLELGTQLLPWWECHSMLDSMGTQKADQERMV